MGEGKWHGCKRFSTLLKTSHGRLWYSLWRFVFAGTALPCYPRDHSGTSERSADITAAIDEAHASGARALNVLASPILFVNRRLILDRVATPRLPAIYQAPEAAEEGGLIAYGPRLAPMFRDVLPRQLLQLFRGVKPADIPIEQPTKFELGDQPEDR